MRKAPGILTEADKKINPNNPSGFKCNCGKDIPQGAVNCGDSPATCRLRAFYLAEALAYDTVTGEAVKS